MTLDAHDVLAPLGAARPVVALLEARMKTELARLVERHGGHPLCVPAVQETPPPDPEVVRGVLDALSAGAHDIVVFMTGVAVSCLFELAEQQGRRAELVSALRDVVTVCRGPKPTAALRGFGVPATLTAREPFTSGELLDALSAIDVRDQRVLLFHYGERSDTLAETLRARHAQLHEVWLYRWELPSEPSGLESLVRSIVACEVDALVVTCQIQFRHLFQVAARMEHERALVRALEGSVVVGAVGPTCKAILEAYGVAPHVVPEHPKMGPLVASLMRHLDARRQPLTRGRSA